MPKKPTKKTATKAKSKTKKKITKAKSTVSKTSKKSTAKSAAVKKLLGKPRGRRPKKAVEESKKLKEKIKEVEKQSGLVGSEDELDIIDTDLDLSSASEQQTDATEKNEEGKELRIKENSLNKALAEKAAATSTTKGSDPVRMYLREMGGVSLLTREGEVVIAKRIERGQIEIKEEIGRSPVSLLYVLEIVDGLKEGNIRVRDLFADDDSSCLLYTSPSPRDATLSRMPSSA